MGYFNPNLKLKEETSLSDHLNEFQEILDQMLGMSIKFEDEIWGLLLLNSLLEFWETFKVSITNLVPNGVVSLQMVNGSVFNEETRRKTQGSSSQSKVMILVFFETESVNLVSNEIMWIIDSGATLYVTPRKEFFTSYTSGDFGVLKMGSDSVTKVIAVGDVCLQTNIGLQLWLRGVKHALDVRFNLIFVHMLDDGANKDMLPGLKNAKLEKCSHCMADKQTRVPFKKHPPSRKLELLELVHSDVCGPLKQGIKHEKTPPKTSQLNGLAERMNKTLIERVSKASVHISKDERSKLDMKTRQCIFIGYGHDGYGHDGYDYRLYDHVEKKLVKSCDVQFMEDQTIEDIDKVKKTTLEKDNSLSEIDPVWMLVHDLDTADNNVQNGEQHNYVGDQQLGDDFDIPLDDDAEEEQEMSQDENPGDASEPLLVQLKRPNRDRKSFTRYTSDEYVTLTDGEEPECYQESMESEERQKAWQSKLQKCVIMSTTETELGFVKDEHCLFCDSQSAIHLGKNSTFHSRSKHIDVRYHWIRDALDAKLLKLTKVNTDDNVANMMTKVVLRGKFEACCEIAGLAITST
ncbi:hypothetical protein CR513_18707, partial [Mucuna pruriens]